MDGPDVSLRGAEHVHHFQWFCGDGHGAPWGGCGQAPVPHAACCGCDRGRRVSYECPGTGDRRAAAPSTRRADLAGQRLRGHPMETAGEIWEDPVLSSVTRI